ncbi:MAG: hypothetical protein EBY32_08140 [Proteobacteria bacterium]|nr:hypothetical protein [Pseudomonadota bacterium]
MLRPLGQPSVALPSAIPDFRFSARPAPWFSIPHPQNGAVQENILILRLSVRRCTLWANLRLLVLRASQPSGSRPVNSG